VVNVALGGTLYQDILQDGPSDADHTTPPERERDFLAHSVNVEESSCLRRLVGAARLQVNSRHHQAVRGVAPALRVTATSDDGVIEALESADGRILTIQCHPENLTVHAWARALFEGFAAAARGRDVR
jgi:putative glutamine amidotransferase